MSLWAAKDEPSLKLLLKPLSQQPRLYTMLTFFEQLKQEPCYAILAKVLCPWCLVSFGIDQIPHPLF